MRGVIASIGKFTNPATGEVIYLPEGQSQPDDAESLEAAGLIVREYKGRMCVSTLVLDQDDARVMAWQHTVNVKCRRLGRPAMFENLPFDVAEEPQEGTVQ